MASRGHLHSAQAEPKRSHTREWLVTNAEGMGIVIYDIGAADAAMELAWNFYEHEGFDPVSAVPFVGQDYPTFF